MKHKLIVTVALLCSVSVPAIAQACEDASSGFSRYCADKVNAHNERINNNRDAAANNLETLNAHNERINNNRDAAANNLETLNAHNERINNNRDAAANNLETLNAHNERINNNRDAAANNLETLNAHNERINSTESRLDAAESRVATSSQAGYEYNAAVTDLKVTEARDLSTFIQQGDDLGSSANVILQRRKDAAIAEKQAVVDALYTDPYKNKDSITDNETAIGVNSGRIDDNEAAIADNRTDIDQNTGDIADNRTDIDQNTGDIADNRTDLDYLAAVSDVPLTEDDTTKPIEDADGNPVLDQDGNPTYEQKPVTEDDLTKPIEDADGNPVLDQDGNPTYEQKPVYGGGTVEKTADVIRSNTANIEEVTTRISHAFTRLDENTARIEANTTAIGQNAAAIAHNTNRIDALEDDVDNLKSGVAMAIAIANAPIITNGTNKFSVSGGIGYYENKTAFSLKGAYMPTDNIAITGSVASDLQNNFAAGAGVGFAF